MHDFRGQSKAATPHRPPPFFTRPSLPLSVKKPSYVGTLVSRLRWGKSVVFASRSLDVSNSALQPEALGAWQTGLAECGVVGDKTSSRSQGLSQGPEQRWASC